MSLARSRPARLSNAKAGGYPLTANPAGDKTRASNPFIADLPRRGRMDPLKLPLEQLLYLRLGQFFDQLHGRSVPDLYRVLLDQVDRAVLRQALERADGQLGAAADFLDVDRNTLSRKARRLKIDMQRASKFK
jgi:DNA-binding protein Fis